MSTLPTAAPRPGGFFRSLAVQQRVIAALMLRELHTRYGRENVGYLWMIGEPMLLATVIGAMHLESGHNDFATGMRPLPFGVLGYTVFILFRGIVNRSEGGVEANAPLLYHRMVTVFDITVARVLLEFAGVFLTSVILLTLIVCVGMGDPPARPLVLLGAWGFMLWYAFGHSLVVTAITYENRTIGRLVHPYSYFMVGLSGAFTPLPWLPHPFREWLSYIPMTSIFELARYGMFAGYKSDYFFAEYLTGACLLLTWIGLTLLTQMRSRIHLA